MTDKIRARIGLCVAVAATIITTLSFYVPALAEPVPMGVQTALWIATAVFVIPFFFHTRVATMDECACPLMTHQEISRRAAEALGEERKTYDCDVFLDGRLTMQINVARRDDRYDVIVTAALRRCTDELTRAIDPAFWDTFSDNVQDAETSNVTAAYLLFVKEESGALEQFLKGGADADVEEGYRRIRVTAAYVEATKMLYVARPSHGEEALFQGEAARISKLLAGALRPAA